MAKSIRNTANQLRIIGGRWRGRKLSFPDTEQLRPTPDRVRETLFNWLQDSIAGVHCLDLFAGSGALGLEALSRGAASCRFVEQNPRVASKLEQNLALLARIAHHPSTADGEQCGPEAEDSCVIQANVTEYLHHPTLARISHRPSTNADPSDLTGRSPSSRLDVVSVTPSPSSGPCTPPSDRRLDALVTKDGEKCRLAPPYQIVFVDPPYGQDLLADTLSLLDQRQWLSPHALIYLEAESSLKTIDLPVNWKLHRSKFAGEVGYHLAIYEPKFIS